MEFIVFITKALGSGSHLIDTSLFPRVNEGTLLVIVLLVCSTDAKGHADPKRLANCHFNLIRERS